MTLTVDRVEWHPEAMQQRVDVLKHEADVKAAERLRDIAAPRVPYATGELLDSAEISHDTNGATLAYGTDHARSLHAHPDWNLHGRSAHWLEDAMAEGDAIQAVYEETVRSGWPS
jgi:hypothetical protein